MRESDCACADCAPASHRACRPGVLRIHVLHPIPAPLHSLSARSIIMLPARECQRCEDRCHSGASKAHAKQTGVPLLGRRPSEESGAAGVVLQIVQLPLSRVAQHLQTPSEQSFHTHLTGHASWPERVLQVHAARGCCLPHLVGSQDDSKVCAGRILYDVRMMRLCFLHTGNTFSLEDRHMAPAASNLRMQGCMLYPLTHATHQIPFERRP